MPAGGPSRHASSMRQATSHYRRPTKPAGLTAGPRDFVTFGSKHSGSGAHGAGTTATKTGNSKVEASPERSDSDDRALEYMVAIIVVSTVLAAVLVAGLAIVIALAGSTAR